MITKSEHALVKRGIRWAESAGALVLVLLSSRSGAAEPLPGVHFEYRAPPGCPTQSEFVSELRARTTRFVEVEAARAARIVNVTIAQNDDGPFSGEVEMRETAEAAPRALRRSVQANLCAELVSAVAVVIAIALDPDAFGSESTSPDPPPTPAKAPPKRAPRRDRAAAVERRAEPPLEWALSGI